MIAICAVLVEELACGTAAGAGLPDVICLEGGLPLMRNGVQVGAIGISGLKAFEDGVVAAAGAAALDAG